MQEAKRTAQNDRELKGVIYAVLELADVFASDNGMFKRERCVLASRAQMSGQGAKDDGSIFRGRFPSDAAANRDC
jgi:hypothetical protein